MCEMEVRPGQRSSTIAQACSHNVSTVDRDLDMFEHVLAARGETRALEEIRAIHVDLAKCYERLLRVFGGEVRHEVEAWNHAIPGENGNERRSLIEQAHHDAELARRHETR